MLPKTSVKLVRMSIPRDELHRLVDEVPPDDLEKVSTYLRGVVQHGVSGVAPRRTFRSMGAFSGPPDLADRSKDILREELWGRAVLSDGWTDFSVFVADRGYGLLWH